MTPALQYSPDFLRGQVQTAGEMVVERDMAPGQAAHPVGTDAHGGLTHVSEERCGGSRRRDRRE